MESSLRGSGGGLRCPTEGGQGDLSFGGWGGGSLKARFGSGPYLQACSPNDSHLQLVRASPEEEVGFKATSGVVCPGPRGGGRGGEITRHSFVCLTRRRVSTPRRLTRRAAQRFVQTCRLHRPKPK